MNGITTNRPAILVEDLRYRYGEFEAVRGIDLSAQPGELLAVLGTNGAGKTTTLEILQGIRRGQGTVRVLGFDPYGHRRRLAGRIGVMFQESALPDELTPLELLDTWRHLTGDPAHRTGPVSLEMVGLDHRARVRIGQLSGGERRRLELAVALSTDPELLFLDEPTAGLDPESRAASWRLIQDLLRRGTTVVLTTHYLEEAQALADRIAILHQGRVEVSGTLDEVVATRRSRIRCDLPPAPAAHRRLRWRRDRHAQLGRQAPRDTHPPPDPGPEDPPGLVRAARRPATTSQGFRGLPGRGLPRHRRTRHHSGGSGMKAILALARAELIMLARNRTAAFNSLLVPLGLSAVWILTSPPEQAASFGAVLQLLIVAGMTVTATATIVLVARRNRQVLQRWRTSGASTPVILGGTLAPLCALLVGQAGIMFAATAYATGSAPARPLLLGAAVVLAGALAAGLAFATAGFTRTVDAANITAFPAMAALFGGGIWPTRPTWARPAGRCSPRAAGPSPNWCASDGTGSRREPAWWMRSPQLWG